MRASHLDINILRTPCIPNWNVIVTQFDICGQPWAGCRHLVFSDQCPISKRNHSQVRVCWRLLRLDIVRILQYVDELLNDIGSCSVFNQFEIFSVATGMNASFFVDDPKYYAPTLSGFARQIRVHIQLLEKNVEIWECSVSSETYAPHHLSVASLQSPRAVNCCFQNERISQISPTRCCSNTS